MPLQSKKEREGRSALRGLDWMVRVALLFAGEDDRAEDVSHSHASDRGSGGDINFGRARTGTAQDEE